MSEQPRPPATGEVWAAVRRRAHAELAATLVPSATAQRRQYAAGHRWLGPELAARLARSKRPEVRWAVAANVAAPADVVQRLRRDPVLGVRERALTNASVPFAHDPEEPAQVWLAHPGCDRALVMEALEGHHRDLALSHPMLGVEGVQDVLDDARARRRGGTAAGGERGSRELRVLLRNPVTTHAQALEVFELDGGRRQLLEWVWSEHRNADSQWLADRARERFTDGDQGLVARVAANPATPAHTLAAIVERHAHRAIALANPACPAWVLAAFLARMAAMAAERGQAHADGYFSGRSVRRTIAVNPSADLEVLAALSADDLGSWVEYDFVAQRAVSDVHAEAMFELGAGWDGSLADLVTVTGAACR